MNFDKSKTGYGKLKQGTMQNEVLWFCAEQDLEKHDWDFLADNDFEVFIGKNSKNHILARHKSGEIEIQKRIFPEVTATWSTCFLIWVGDGCCNQAKQQINKILQHWGSDGVF